jgi:hypothetical protein
LESSASAGHVTSAVLDPRRWRALALIYGAFFMALLAGTITIAALPSIGAGLRFSEQGLRWVLSAYALTVGGLLRLGGRAADLLTARHPARHPASRLYDRGLSHVGLRVTGYSILSRLAAEGPMPVGDLARRLAMQRATRTREVAPLVRSGLVEAAAGPIGVSGYCGRPASASRNVRTPIRYGSAQQEVAAEFGGAEVQELLIRLRRLTGGSERLAGIRTEVDH